MRGDNHVDTSGAGFLRQAGDLRFHRFFLGHHQIGQLINHHHNLRQFFQRLGFIGVQAKWVKQRFFRRLGSLNFLVVARQIAHARIREQAIAFFHLGNAPIKRVARFAHIGNHGAEQMRDAVINA